MRGKLREHNSSRQAKSLYVDSQIHKQAHLPTRMLLHYLYEYKKPEKRVFLHLLHKNIKMALDMDVEMEK